MGAVDEWGAEKVLARTVEARSWPMHDSQDGRDRWAAQARRGAARILDWLNTFPGQGWQQRWQAAEVDHQSTWLDVMTTRDGTAHCNRRLRAEVVCGLNWMLLARVVQPGYAYFAQHDAIRVFDVAARLISPELFTRIGGGSDGSACTIAGVTAVPATLSRARVSLIKLALHTGTDLAGLTEADLLELRWWGLARDNLTPRGLSTSWDLLARSGVLPAGSTLRGAVRTGQRTVTDLVGAYGLRNHAVAQVIIRYISERAPGLDYTSVKTLVGILVGNFWADIEAHHPETLSTANGLVLPDEVALAWKQRLQHTITSRGVVRDDTTRYSILMGVRAFYLDMAEWAHTDPSWAPSAVASPVRRRDVEGFDKSRSQVTARIHQRIRTRTPQLPALVAAAETHLDTQRDLLAAARTVRVEDTFTHAGVTYRRRSRAHTVARSHPDLQGIVVEQLDSGARSDLTDAEDEAFWAWAIIETLRHTGVRLEELLELTQLALISYRLPSTGEVVPLLQIVPSKSNEERLLLVGPELASVLATIITRLRSVAGGGTIPLVARYDQHECVTGPPLPHLFQHRRGSALQAVISYYSVRKLLDATAARAGVTDPAGTALRFTAHDFRRIFTTEAVNSGLPIHIAARLLGHHSVATTQAYHAVFQEDLIRAYRSFLDHRRATRPQAEYHQPSPDEWREFEQHFERRTLELGTCGRPYASPCSHEHACIRCPMLRVDPRQHQRLVEIVRNLSDRITEARINGWHGEVEGLQISLNAGQAKLAALNKAAAAPSTPRITDLGIPVIAGQP